MSQTYSQTVSEDEKRHQPEHLHISPTLTLTNKDILLILLSWSSSSAVWSGEASCRRTGEQHVVVVVVSRSSWNRSSRRRRQQGNNTSLIHEGSCRQTQSLTTGKKTQEQDSPARSRRLPAVSVRDTTITKILENVQGAHQRLRLHRFRNESIEIED